MKKLFRPDGLLTRGTLLFVLLAASIVCARAGGLYGVTSEKRLVRVESPLVVIGFISGLQPGEFVRGLDFRPATGQLYLLGVTGNIGPTGRLYTVDRHTAVATPVGILDVSLFGSRYGFEFDPLTDRIRVISNGGQNLSVNPNDATVVTHTPLNPGSPQGTVAAYTNGYRGATSTTLYVWEGLNGILYTMANPSLGTLTQVPGSTGQGIVIDDFEIDPITGTAICAISLGGGHGGYAAFSLTTGTFGPFAILPNNTILTSIAILPDGIRAARLDFDRDRRSDYSVFRPSTNDWYVQQSLNSGLFTAQFGIAGDVLTPGDYDGDERTDVAVWRPGTGDFYVLRSNDGTVQSFHFGQSGDEPVVGDFDGDGITDFAVVRRTGGQMIWYSVNALNGNFRATAWGLDTDIIAPGDYDGDGICDLGIRRGSGAQPATFHILGSIAGYSAVQWGIGSDIIVPGDYDRDGKADFAVLRPETEYKWYVLRSSNNSFAAYQFGSPPQVAAPGDYDGDGQTDLAVFSPQLGTFYTLKSSSGAFTAVQFGQNGDVPLASYDTR